MRLFVAVEPAEAVRDWVGRVEGVLRPLAPELRWVSPANAHLTLAFLGEQKEARLALLEEAVAAAAASAEPFDLSFGPLGAFDSFRRARVLWVGLGRGAEELVRLAAALGSELAGRRFPVEERDFQAHLTLARAREPGPAEALLAAALPPAPVARVEELSIMRSVLSPKGARYERVRTARLGRRPG